MHVEKMQHRVPRLSFLQLKAETGECERLHDPNVDAE